MARRHLGCSVHGSAFQFAAGADKAVPSTEPLAFHALRFEGDDVLVDTDSITAASSRFLG